ncbi:hypothetical protein GGX14DRAFT_673866 [Mycena pura]|uniref:Short-chain dehydrogenase/reductase family protein n=1 Tax=Mycena pura TaxID=153505 RepID=A0AAD6V025_9AGAR|nr:hypothetical protein GGX14DRAFT_673866 [Mycena pura]
MSAYPTFSFNTTADEVATAFSQEIEGKNVLITGTSLNGIGFEAARVIAKHANLVVITGYNDERLKLSEEAIKKDVPAANIRRLALDLASLAGVRKAAAEVNTYAEPLHVLIHNAAAAIGPFKLTVDNLESQIATDHIGPFLFTKLIVRKLLASATPSYTPRVVFVSSAAHGFGTGVDFATLAHVDAASYDTNDRYWQANVHPGLIFTNIIQKEESIAGMQVLGILGPDGQPDTKKFQWKTIPQGAATTVTAAFDPRIDDKPGAYLDDSNVANESVAAHSSNPGNAAKLWTATEEIVGETFTF